MRFERTSFARATAVGLAAVATVAASFSLAVPATASSDPAPIVIGAVSGFDPDKIVVEEGARAAEYHYTIDLPAGATLRPLTDTAEGSEFAGEALLEDSAGASIGAYDQPLAMSADNTLLPSTYRIQGSTLIQTVDFTGATFPVVIDPIYTAVTQPGMMSTMAFVGVPSNYVYNPSLGTLNDYCSYSPDEYPSPVGANANFRGPCARHDQCYGGGVTSKLTCDNRLFADMKSNCEHFYKSSFDPNRLGCLTTAEVYWLAVVGGR